MKRKVRDEQLLDDLYASSDPEVRQAFAEIMQEEMTRAQGRALARLARRFRHLIGSGASGMGAAVA